MFRLKEKKLKQAKSFLKNKFYKHKEQGLLKKKLFLDDNKVLENALAHLMRQKNDEKCKLSKTKTCKTDDFVQPITDQQIRLKCRQLPNVVEELRKSVLRQDWNETVALLIILCSPGLISHAAIILRVCFIVLFSHPKSNYELLYNFIRNTTGYILEEDIRKFIKILFILKSSKKLCISNNFNRNKYYKIIRNPEFDNIK